MYFYYNVDNASIIIVISTSDGIGRGETLNYRYRIITKNLPYRYASSIKVEHPNGVYNKCKNKITSSYMYITQSFFDIMKLELTMD